MPIDWNTTVIHLFTNHTIDTIKALGPFNAANILDIERFHTLFKSLARGKENVMASIKNHYLLLEVSLSARMSAEVDWTSLPAKSTPAGYAGRLDSEDKADRMCQPFGKVTCTTLTSDEYRLVQTLWADSYPIYKNLHRRYNAWVRHNIRSRKNTQTLDKWVPRPAGLRNASAPDALTNEEKNWQQMTNGIKVARMLAHCRSAGSRSHSQSLRHHHTSFCAHSVPRRPVQSCCRGGMAPGDGCMPCYQDHFGQERSGPPPQPQLAFHFPRRLLQTTSGSVAC